MDAFNYFKELKRLCNCYDCPECPLYNLNFGKGCNIGQDATDEDINNLISSVENWAKEHSQKTMLQDFLEKHPKAKIYQSGNQKGTPKVCPHNLGYCKDNSFCDNHSCFDCWNRPLEE